MKPLLLALFICSGLSHADVRETVVETVGLRLGNYILISGYDNAHPEEEACDVGDLAMNSSEDGVNYVLGPHILVESVGTGKFTRKEAGCEYSFSSTYSAGKIHATKKAVCKDRPTFSSDVTVSVTAEGFDYVRLVMSGKHITFDEHCRLKRN